MLTAAGGVYFAAAFAVGNRRAGGLSFPRKDEGGSSKTRALGIFLHCSLTLRGDHDVSRGHEPGDPQELHRNRCHGCLPCCFAG